VIEHYKVKNGRLLYSAAGRSEVTKKGSTRAWKVVVKTEEERGRILNNCHSGSLNCHPYADE